MEHIVQLLRGAAWDKMLLLLALACHMQSALSSLHHFCTCPREPNPLDLCAGGNKFSSLLSSQSRLISLVVSATIIKVEFWLWSWESDSGDQAAVSQELTDAT